MPLLFNNGQQQRTVYNNPISVNDFNSSGLTETKENIRMETASMTFRNWCFEGFRMGRFVLEQNRETIYEIKNNIDAVKIYFNRRGSHHSNYRQVSKKVLLRSGQCNMLYSDELDTQVSHIDDYSEIFTLQFTRECFLDLLEQGGIVMDQFSGKLARRQPALFSNQWLSIDPAMDRCIHDILHCPFRADMKKIYLRSKAIELLVLFAGSADERKPTGFQVKDLNDKEKLYFARDYLTQNYANPNSLPELAKIAGLNEYKLKQGFKSLFNTSAIDFLINYRLEHAHDLLLNTQKSISEVAYETGYTSPSYFGKAFKKKYGFSPKKTS
jgi:AraC family transcriptional activator of pyochelin receptor